MTTQSIDRFKLVNRHNPVIRGVEPLAPLAVGNGEFAYNVDVTGMQSFPEAYVTPLGTQSHWGWHYSGGRGLHTEEELSLQQFETYGRQVGYAVSDAGHEEAYHWLRQNPHRMQLGQVGLSFLLADGSRAAAGDLKQPEQALSLWEGMLESKYEIEGKPVRVWTCCHPNTDQIGIRIESPLLAEGRIAVRFDFPASDAESNEWAKSISLNWNHASGHRTQLEQTSPASARWTRQLDEDGYQVAAVWTQGYLHQESEHRFVLRTGESLSGQLSDQAHAPKASEASAAVLELSFGFSPGQDRVLELTTFNDIAAASKSHWARFWTEGGAVDFSGSTDPRAVELERRVVLSQFNLALHSAGSLPPQETGLMYNSWYGKPHLEMHWWHALQFGLWGRTQLLERSMGWYNEILPVARRLAASQGYSGARWPKMVGPDGAQSPSPIATLLIWQQPHPIVLAELVYRSKPTEDTLQLYADIVQESAEFMASFTVWDEAGQRYVLGPPMIPAQENHAPGVTLNPTYELEYWHYALELAQTWRERRGLSRDAGWAHICRNLSPLPVGPSGVDDTRLPTDSENPHGAADDTGFDAFSLFPGVTGEEGREASALAAHDVSPASAASVREGGAPAGGLDLQAAQANAESAAEAAIEAGSAYSDAGRLSTDSVYWAHERCPESFTRFNQDHPSMLGALGMLPGALVDLETMRRTLQTVVRFWRWDTSWGWDFPMAAMTAARLGEPEQAVDLLLMDQVKNKYLPNGHNYQRPGLTSYLPGNGGLLIAVAMMACGWGTESTGSHPSSGAAADNRVNGGHAGERLPHAPGFPQDGSWVVRWEGLSPLD
ncbi:glycoside hydrolase family 65 [Paenibacillus sp. y28]|uniref:glycoside hydrolase family 65 n=1 Tax=Paenibacillus sp. y28 TaxID=3129110 RepID=UPI003019DE22